MSFVIRIINNKVLLKMQVLVCTLVLLVLFSSRAYGYDFVLCSGREFNERVMGFLNWRTGSKTDNTITRFTRGYNPPKNPAYYVDVSRYNDGTVIVYKVEDYVKNMKDDDKYTYTLYWYADGDMIINQDLSYMFENFTNLKSVDLSDFVYINGVTDTRYMFSNCRRLKSVTFKTKHQKQFMNNFYSLSEMQGMFFNCQSLQNIDLYVFDTKFVSNMDEVFYKCYNLQNVFVSEDRWNTENVMTANRMFSECHSLISSKGKKAVDIDEGDYISYLNIGTDEVDGFLKSTDYAYDYYDEDEDLVEKVPIEDDEYIKTEAESIQNYEEEAETDKPMSSSAKDLENESSIIYEDIGEVISNTSDNTENNLDKNSDNTSDFVVESLETDKKVIELDEYLKLEENETESEEGDNSFLSKLNISDETLVFILVILGTIILLLVGMLVYLLKYKKDNS